MPLENKLGITDSTELAKAEERISKAEVYMKGVDASYRYEGYNTYKTGEI